MWREHPALCAALLYAVIGLIWITLSDQFVAWLAAHDESRVTLIQTYKGWFWILLTTTIIFVLVDISVRAAREADTERHASDARYRPMIETTNEGVVVAGDDGRCQYVNRTFARMVGAEPEEVIRKRCGECVCEEHRPMVERLLSNPQADRPQRFDCELKHKDGSSVWTIVSASPIVDPTTGRPATLFMVTDITARKLAERALERNLEMQRGLLNELDHRVRNNLSSLSSLIDLSRGSSGSVDEFARTIGGRVQAMAKAHALVGQSASGGMDLRRVLEEMVPPRLRARIMFEGPAVRVDGHQIIPLAMLMHEMLSRSAALNSGDGRVKVRWEGADAGPSEVTVEMRWIETPPPATLGEPQADIVAGLVRSDLRGEIEATADGYRLRLTLQQPQPMNA